MDNIIEPNKQFDFSKITLAHPSGIQGGAYFTQILCDDKPLYIQTTRSLTRQGLIKNGKKYYCDLMFDNNSEGLIEWFENLEEKCQKLLFSKSDAWFQGSLELNDIENAFNSVIRVYKSGKYYLVRVNIKCNTVGEPNIKIYNENETILNMEAIKQETNIISVLEIQGIKFTSRNFQFEMELKQMMVLDNEPIFDKCLIKKVKKNENVYNENIIINKHLEINNTDEDKINESLEQDFKEDEFKEEDLKEDDDIKEDIKEDEFKEDDDIKEVKDLKEDEKLKEDELREIENLIISKNENENENEND